MDQESAQAVTIGGTSHTGVKVVFEAAQSDRNVFIEFMWLVF